jgi:hypothetical protein
MHALKALTDAPLSTAELEPFFGNATLGRTREERKGPTSWRGLAILGCEDAKNYARVMLGPEKQHDRYTKGLWKRSPIVYRGEQ